MLNFNPIKNVWIKAAEYLLAPPAGLHVPWWPEFTKLMGGLRMKELTLLCAPTGAGKTQWLAALAAQLMLIRVPMYIAPVETGDTDFIIRILENLDQSDLNTGEAHTIQTAERLQEKYGALLKDYPMYISTHDNRVPMQEMVDTLTFMSQQYGVKLALLDNLNFFLNVTSTQMEKAEMDNAIHDFVMLVKELPMHIILVVHPRKTEKGRVESEFDIKGSSTAVQECANVILFNRAKPEDLESRKRSWSDREMIFRKVRKKGTTVGKSLWFNFDRGRYEEIDA